MSEPRRPIAERKAQCDRLLVAAQPCPGCGRQPIAEVSFGKFRFACPSWVSRDADRTTDACIGSFRPMHVEPSTAAGGWRLACREPNDLDRKR